MVSTPVLVGMADLKLIKGTGTLSCIGLGSCIGLLMVDADSKVAGMVHIMLPKAFEGRPVDKIGKFADTGIPELLNQMVSAGARKSRLKVVIAGGAQVFKFGASADSKLEVGKRNCEAVVELLKAHQLQVEAEDLGGSEGRTVNFDLATGEFRVRTLSRGEQSLCTIK